MAFPYWCQIISTVNLILAKFLSSKGHYSPKKMNQKFLQICTSTQYELRVPIVESILSTL